MRTSAYDPGFDLGIENASVFPKHCTGRVSNRLWKFCRKQPEPLNVCVAQSAIVAFPFDDRRWSGTGLMPGVRQGLAPENQILSHIFLSTVSHLQDGHLDSDLTQRVKHRIWSEFVRQEMMGIKIHDFVLATKPSAGFQEVIESGERGLYDGVPSVIAVDAKSSAVSRIMGQVPDDMEPQT